MTTKVRGQERSEFGVSAINLISRWGSAMCRFPPPAMLLSVTAMEKAGGKRNPPGGDGGLINHVTDLRVLIIIVEYCPANREAVH